jgi:hypothetical protein
MKEFENIAANSSPKKEQGAQVAKPLKKIKKANEEAREI